MAEDIITKLLDLQRQATVEKSHYYVAECVTEAIQAITGLREQLRLADVLVEAYAETIGIDPCVGSNKYQGQDD